jgi:uncharacterized membrane protein
MKCILCEKEAQYIQSGMSLCEEHFKAKQLGSTETELLKIQIQTDKFHTLLTSTLSFILAFFSTIAVFIGLYYEGLIMPNFNIFLAGLTGTIVILALTFAFLVDVRKSYSKDLEKVSKMIEAVKKGEQLPPLDKLNKWESKES